MVSFLRLSVACRIFGFIYAVDCMRSDQILVYHLLSTMEDVTWVVLQHILEEEERDEQIINLLNKRNIRKKNA